MTQYTAADLDPIIRATEEDMRKFHHHFEEGQTVRIKASGHQGQIVRMDSHNRISIKLSSGHLVNAHLDEVEPADFPANETAAPSESQNLMNVYDPIWGRSELPGLNSSPETVTALQPIAKAVHQLTHSLESGTVSVADRVTIQTALAKIATGQYVVDSCIRDGEDYSSPFHILRILADKYASADTSNRLSKRAKSQFERSLKVGDSVRDNFGRIGKITAITEHSVSLDYGNGATGISLFGYFQAA